MIGPKISRVLLIRKFLPLSRLHHHLRFSLFFAFDGPILWDVGIIYVLDGRSFIHWYISCYTIKRQLINLLSCGHLMETCIVNILSSLLLMEFLYDSKLTTAPKIIGRLLQSYNLVYSRSYNHLWNSLFSTFKRCNTWYDSYYTIMNGRFLNHWFIS